MSLNIYNIYESLILESVGRNQIIDAINRPLRVKISYQGENKTSPSDYTIDPYVYGVSLAGNDIIRAYQPKGPDDLTGGVEMPDFLRRGKSKSYEWKTFRVDRILQWKPTGFKLNKQHPVSYEQPSIKDFREDGYDEKMVKIYASRKFGEKNNVDTFNQAKGDTSNKNIPVTPTKKVIMAPKAEPKAQPTAEPIKEPQKVAPKAQPTVQQKVEPKINKPLPIKKQPDITANPEDETDINQKI